MQLHTAHKYFKGDTREVGTVLGLLTEKIDIEMDFDKFKEKLKGYAERKFDNSKYGMYVVTEIEDPVKKFEDNNMPGYLFEE